MKIEKLNRQKEEERRHFRESLQKINHKIDYTEEKIERQRQMASDLMSGKVEKNRLIARDTMENDRRMKLMRQNFNTQMMIRHQFKDEKINEMHRILMNSKGEPVDALYESMKL